MLTLNKLENLQTPTNPRKHQVLCRLRSLLTLVFLVFLMTSALFKARPMLNETDSLVVLLGKLIQLDGKPLIFETAGKRLQIEGANEPVSATLRDPHLAGRKMRLEGKINKQGIFEITKLFTIRQEQLYKVRYYCEICNITDLSPGTCACCQGPTEFQEIPATKENNWR